MFEEWEYTFTYSREEISLISFYILELVFDVFFKV
jgi:hypothetical protein